jgi:NAD(P)-dependent dehydrogenase (short-subunit alcohol dehydrogenase family)
VDAEAGAGSEDRRLAGRVAVIAGIGGAIGGAVATCFAREGAVVVGIDRVALGIDGQLYLADLTDETETKEVFAHIKSAHGRIDVVYNNAGSPDSDDHSRHPTRGTKCFVPC